MSDTFALSQGQGHKLEKAVIRNNGTTADMEWLCEKENFQKVVLLARGEAVLTLKEKPVSKEEPPFNTIIKVDRSVKPVYPDWMKKVMHPELEGNGPAEYDLANVEQWLHEGQKDGKWTKGDNIYARLKENDNELLKTCLTLRDGEEIKKNGIEAFRKFFKGKVLFLWGSVVLSRGGDLDVPYLGDDGGEVVVSWGWVGYGWGGSDPAGRLAS